MAAVSFLVIAVSPDAADAARPVGIHMVGQGLSRTCSDWLSSAHSKADRTAMLAWVAGFVSQASLSLADLAAIDEDGIATFLDAECAAHPQIRLHMAASLLVGKLRHGR
jgi:hypothetical protein